MERTMIRMYISVSPVTVRSSSIPVSFPCSIDNACGYGVIALLEA